ncbi:MAG: hypothetical protein ACRDAX_01125 [Propionibacteriaceae bacterium]
MGASHHSATPVGGCLANHWKVWQELGAEQWVVDVLRIGYLIPFEVTPPLTDQPLPHVTYAHRSQKATILQDEVKKMMEKGAVQQVCSPTKGFYSRIFLVPKANGEWRTVIDLSTLNLFIRKTSFKMETPKTVLQAVRIGDFMLTVDLKDAYFQIPVHQSSRKFLRFSLQGKLSSSRSCASD